MKLKVTIKKIKGNYYIASCQDFPGCHVQASSEKQASTRLREAIKLMTISYQQHHENLPIKY